MTKDRYTPTERIGISDVQSIVLKQFKWIFREQPIADYGIDAHIETSKKGNPTGKLIAVQIKTGESHFKVSKDSYTYYINKTHADYWLNHSLPVIFIGVIPEDSIVIWQPIKKGNIESTQRGYKTVIPKKNIFKKDDDVVYQLENLAEGSGEFQKLKKLLLDRPLINYLSQGGNIYVEFEQWVNKLLGRTTIKVFFDDEQKYLWSYYFTGYTIIEFIAHIFPWADLSIDTDFYDIHFNFQEDDYYYKRQFHEKIYPYANEEISEVDLFRVKLELNDLGRSCIHLFDYMDG